MGNADEELQSSAQGFSGHHIAGGHSARATYEAMARCYDDFTANHDFELWLGNLLPAVEQQALPEHQLLDVGCGTGKSFLPMIDRGWSVTACDISPLMVAIAESKAAHRKGAAVKFAVADMRELPVFGEFALVWSLTDALNYLLSEKELVAALTGMASNLHPEGVLVFDLNSLMSFRTFFAEEVVVETGGRKMTWRGEGSRDAMEPVDESEPSVPAIHRERHFPESQVLAALEHAGLQCVDVFGIHYDAVLQQPLDEERHTKAVYLAKRTR